jgi:hypothetical protein
MNKISSSSDKLEIRNHLLSCLRPFKPQLPLGLPSLFCVDALPALQAKQEKKTHLVFLSGIFRFEFNLLTAILLQKKIISVIRFPRVVMISRKVKLTLQSEAQSLSAQIVIAENLRNAEIEQGKQEVENLKNDFEQRINAYKEWLTFDNLVSAFLVEAAHALQEQKLDEWQRNRLQSVNTLKIKTIELFIQKACKRIGKTNEYTLLNSVPPLPSPTLPDRPSRNFGQWFGDIFNGGENRAQLDQEYERAKWETYKSAVETYFHVFSKSSISSLEDYHKNVSGLFSFSIPPETRQVTDMRNKLLQLNKSINEITGLDSLFPKNNNFIQKIFEFCNTQIFLLKSWAILRLSL